MEVVIGPVAQAAEILQVCAGLLHLRNAAVLEPQGEIGMRPIGPRNGEPQVLHSRRAT